MGPDAWTVGDGYESYMGRWSRAVAREFVGWLGAPQGQRWLDVGCGTGALTGTIVELAQPSAVTGVDPSEHFLGHARARVGDPRARFVVGDATSIPVDDASIDLAVSALALNFVPDPQRAARELARVTRHGGHVAVYIWDYAEGMQLIRYFWDAAIALDPSASALDEGLRFPICRPEPLEALFAGAGLAGVEVVPIEIPTVFEDFDAYWRPFLSAQGPAPGYCMALEPTQRAALQARLRTSLPVRADGSIHLTARAWAIRGQRHP